MRFFFCRVYKNGMNFFFHLIMICFIPLIPIKILCKIVVKKSQTFGNGE